MKLYRNILIVVLIILALSAAFYFVGKLTPKTEEFPPVTETETYEDQIFVYQAKTEDVLSLRIKNASEEYTLTQKNKNWVLNNDASLHLNQQAVKNLLLSCTSVSVKSVIEETAENAAAFGLSIPTGFAELTMKDGSKKTITIGTQSVDGENYYISLSDDPKVYLKNAYGVESMIPSSMSLRTLELYTINLDDFSNILSFEMEKQGNTPVRIEQKDAGTEDSNWKIVKPVISEVNGITLIEKVLAPMESFTMSAIVEDHARNLGKYGLLNPYATFSLTFTDKTSYNVKIGAETENYRYIMTDRSETVYAIEKSKLAFLNVAYMDLMSRLIHVEYITEVDRVEVSTQDKTYKLEILSGDKRKINGVSIEKSAFSKVYQQFIGISMDKLTFDALASTDAEVEIKYYKNDGSVVTVSYVPVNDRTFRALVDGEGNWLTAKKNFYDAVAFLEETVKKAK